MRKIISLILFVCLVSGTSVAQISPGFTVPSQVCIGSTIVITANTGTSTANGFSWTASGAVFSNSSAATTSVSFPNPGVFTITLAASSGTSNGSASNTISVISPTVSVASPVTSVCPGYSTSLYAFGAVSYTWFGNGLPSGGVAQNTLSAVAGTYYVVQENTAGCHDTVFHTVGASPPLSVSVTASSFSTCITNNFPKYSNPVHLTASGAQTYVLFPYNPAAPAPTVQGAFDVRPASSTCYTVQGYTSNCSGSATVCISVVQQASFAVTPSSLVICKGASASLSAGIPGAPALAPFTYSWNESLNAPPISMSSYVSQTVQVFPQNPCTYTAEVKDAANCISEPVTVSVAVIPCTRIEEQRTENKVQLFPNPAKEELVIGSTWEGSTKLEVYDAFGRLVMKDCFLFYPPEHHRLPVSDLKPGMYVVILETPDGTIVRSRFVKE